MTTLEHLRAAAAVRNRNRQREIQMDDFALVGERVQLQTTQPKQPKRAVDFDGPMPPDDLVEPIQETLL